MRKPIQQRGNRNAYKSKALDLLSCESLILHFLHQGAGVADDVRSIKEISLFEFWKYIQDEKDSLNTEREKE